MLKNNDMKNEIYLVDSTNYKDIHGVDVELELKTSFYYLADGI